VRKGTRCERAQRGQGRKSADHPARLAHPSAPDSHPVAGGKLISGSSSSISARRAGSSARLIVSPGSCCRSK